MNGEWKVGMEKWSAVNKNQRTVLLIINYSIIHYT